MRTPVVLITGAGGEIGHGLISSLAQEGSRAVITLDVNPLEPALGKMVSRGLGLAAELGIADQLRRGPRSAEDLGLAIQVSSGSAGSSKTVSGVLVLMHP